MNKKFVALENVYLDSSEYALLNQGQVYKFDGDVVRIWGHTFSEKTINELFGNKIHWLTDKK